MFFVGMPVAIAAMAFTQRFSLAESIVLCAGLAGSFFLVLTFFMIFQDRRWMVLLAAPFIRDGMPVELVCHEGRFRCTFARREEDGLLVAPVYWIAGIGKCILLGNGRIDEGSDSCYVCFWLPIEREKRFMHAMAADLPDLGRLRTCKPDQRRDIMRQLMDGHAK